MRLADTPAEVPQLRAALIRAQRQLTQAKAKTEHLVEATIEAAHDAMLAQGPIPPVPRPAIDRRAGKPEVALLHMTDWVTTSYNSRVMRQRVLRFCDKVDELVAIHPPWELTIAKATNKKPRVTPEGSVVVKLRLRLPCGAFDPLAPSVVVEVPEDLLISGDDVTVEAVPDE